MYKQSNFITSFLPEVIGIGEQWIGIKNKIKILFFETLYLYYWYFLYQSPSFISHSRAVISRAILRHTSKNYCQKQGVIQQV